jgi:hypothetical protein
VRRRIADACGRAGLSGGLNWRGRRKTDTTSGNVVAQRCMTRCTRQDRDMEINVPGFRKWTLISLRVWLRCRLREDDDSGGVGW